MIDWWKEEVKSLVEITDKLSFDEFAIALTYIVDLEMMLEAWQANKDELEIKIASLKENFEYATQMSYENFLKSKGTNEDRECRNYKKLLADMAHNGD